MITLQSSAFADNHPIPDLYTCYGKDINPPLEILTPPVHAKSLVLMVSDPDAPMGIFTHWLVWNIDPITTIVDSDSIPTGGTQGLNGAGTNKYLGPCPPSGTHRYFFQIFALDTFLDLSPSTNRSQLESALMPHLIESATLVGLYSAK